MNRRTALSLMARFSVASMVPSFWIMGCDADPWAGSNGDCRDQYFVRYMARFNDSTSDHDHIAVPINAAVVEAAIDAGDEFIDVTVLGSGGGAGSHAHIVRLSFPQNIDSLKRGGRLALTTRATEGAHTHQVFVAC
ncbi:MAG: hypothetical protein JRG89_12540 [Deltaproteobacteria bacterium]|nr:hypothetical protein [Deltaproteobacteria bacterium]